MVSFGLLIIKTKKYALKFNFKIAGFGKWFQSREKGP